MIHPAVQTATNAALEPLDVERLKETAMKGLRDKAINRMKLQGVSKDQQEVGDSEWWTAMTACTLSCVFFVAISNIHEHPQSLWNINYIIYP